MGESQETRREIVLRKRRRSIGLSLAGILALVAFSLFARCSGGDEVTAQSIAQAKKTWEASNVRDYELEWMASGITNAHYYVTVRRGKVQRVESVTPDGQRHELHPAEPRFYGVEGLFTTMADELAQLKTERPFGQPPGAKVVMRFQPDQKLGYPRYYRRDVLGTPQGLRIDVIRLIPNAS
jgi:hypothetical protein